MIKTVRPFISVSLMLAALLWPALWNGFPIIFADTGGYLEPLFDGALTIGRSAFYGTFLALGMPLDFWPNIVAQAAATIWVIWLLVRTHCGERPWLAVSIVVLLAALTSLPWYVSQLMPDCLFSLGVLAFYLLAFRRDALGRKEVIGLVALIAFAVASHMGFLAIALVLLLAFAVWRTLARRFGRIGPAPELAAAAAGAGFALTLLFNAAVAGQFALTPGSTSFLFARLVQDGLVARYLADECPQPEIRLCGYRHALPATADGWLWGDSPFHQLGGDEGYEDEERRIIGATLWRYPIAHVRTAAKAAFDQFLLVKTTASVSTLHNSYALDTLSRLAPDLVPRLMAARQQQPGGFEFAPRSMPWLRAPVQENDAFAFVPLNIVHVPVAFAAVAFLILIAAGHLRRPAPPDIGALALTILFALVANAAISGIFSNPVDRYQSRLIWLAPLAVAMATFGRKEHDAAAFRPLNLTFPPQPSA